MVSWQSEQTGLSSAGSGYTDVDGEGEERLNFLQLRPAIEEEGEERRGGQGGGG